MFAWLLSFFADVGENNKSEFGAGVVVCLAKFSEHLHNDRFEVVVKLWQWKNMPEEKRAEKIKEAEKYPRGDAANLVRTAGTYGRIYGPDDDGISHAIAMWMNGASDHFYDLDREKSPQSLTMLADLCLEIGHGSGLMGEKKYTWQHVEEIRVLWRNACLEVDTMLGVNADWGEW